MSNLNSLWPLQPLKLVRLRAQFPLQLGSLSLDCFDTLFFAAFLADRSDCCLPYRTYRLSNGVPLMMSSKGSGSRSISMRKRLFSSHSLSTNYVSKFGWLVRKVKKCYTSSSARTSSCTFLVVRLVRLQVALSERLALYAHLVHQPIQVTDTFLTCVCAVTAKSKN